jgi:hypothetical protein
MATYAVINGGTVVQAIIADSVEDAELLTGFTCVEIKNNEAGPRYTWDGEKFVEPVYPEKPAATPTANA